jgi:enoyl-CoA hydratase
MSRACPRSGTPTEACSLGVKATIASARKALHEGEAAAAAALRPALVELMGSADAQEGMLSFIERRGAKFTGR